MLKSLGFKYFFKVIVLYIGSVIGAGFASGQEIMQFFTIYGTNGLWGVLLSALLFTYLGGLVMFLAVHYRTSSYKDIYREILGKVPGRIMDALSLIMLPGGLVVMLAGGGAVFSEHFGLPGFLGTALIAVVVTVVIYKGIHGVVSANAILVPIKMAVIVIVCLIALMSTQHITAGEIIEHRSLSTNLNWVWSAILYVSYNMVLIVAVLSSLGKVTPLEPGLSGGILGGVALGLVAFIMVLTSLHFYPQITGYEIPLLYIASSQASAVKTALGLLIWMAILTTAIADAHGFASRFAESNSARYKAIGLSVVLLALPLSTLKFSFLVKLLYPLFGYVGLLLLFALLFIPPARYLKRKLF